MMKPPSTSLKFGVFKSLIFVLQILVGLLSPAILLILALFYIWKKIVMQIAKLIGKNFIGSVSPLDLIFISDTFTKNPHSMVPLVFILEGKLDVKRITSDFQKIFDEKIPENNKISKYWRLAVHPRKFLGYWVWESVKNFSVENQIHILDDKVDTEYDFPLLMEKLLRREVKDGSPLWEVLIVKNYLKNPQKSLFIYRFSHAISDGITALKLYYKWCGVDKLPETIPISQEEKIPISKQIFYFMKLITCGLYNVLDVFCAIPDENPLRNSGNNRSSKKWICSMTNRLDIGLIKKARKERNCKLFDVLLSGIIGGMRKYMNKYFPHEPIPSHLHAVLPASKPNHPDDTFINHWNFLIMKIPVHLTNGQLDNVQEIKRSTQSEMAGTFAPFSTLILSIILTLPLASYSEALTNFNGLTLLCSAVPGPPETLPMFGLHLEEIIHFMPINRNDIAILSWGAFPCNNLFRISLTADTAYITTKAQLDDLADMIEQEFKDLSETT